MIYELLYIIPNKYSEDEAKKLHSKILELAKKNGFEVTNEENLGSKKLAYPIKHVYYGYYFLIHFKLAEKANLVSFNQKLGIMPEVLRSQIVKYNELPQKVEILKNAPEIKHEAKKEKPEEKVEAEKIKDIKEVKEAEHSIASEEPKAEGKAGDEKEKKEETKEEKKEDEKKDEKKKIDLNDLDKKIDELLENVDR